MNESWQCHPQFCISTKTRYLPRYFWVWKHQNKFVSVKDSLIGDKQFSDKHEREKAEILI